jgi:predicted amidohydrolase
MEPSVMRNEIYNSVAYVELGTTLGLYRKIHLPVEENHYFVPGTEVVVIDATIGRVALSVCYDMIFPEVSRLAALKGAELMLVPSNWLDIANLRRTGEVLPVARAIEGQMHVVFVNGVGDLNVRGRSWALFGRSCVVSATGEVVAKCGPDEEVLTAKLTRADLEAASDVFPVLRDRRPELYGELTAPLTRFGRWKSEAR